MMSVVVMETLLGHWLDHASAAAADDDDDGIDHGSDVMPWGCVFIRRTVPSAFPVPPRHPRPPASRW
jgi:hypothetical protein